MSAYTLTQQVRAALAALQGKKHSAKSDARALCAITKALHDYDADEKRDAEKIDHARRNAAGWSETINDLVRALECDFDTLEDLRDEREALQDALNETSEEHSPHGRKTATEALRKWDEENGDALRELTEAATVDGIEFKEREHVEQRIQESPLSVQVRSGWYQPGDVEEARQAEEFEILLSTGGPALRIRGELDEHQQPRRAWLEMQDWFTPWTEYHGEHAPSQETLVTFCSQFYFGG